jgi:ribosomal protein S13
MSEGKKINGQIFYTSYSLSDFFFKYTCYGFSKKFYFLIISRLESRFERKLLETKTSQIITIYKILQSTVPEHRDLKKKQIFNIFMLDLINSYRGARHAFGLPTRGQRT